MLTANRYHPHAHRPPSDRLVLAYEDRFLRRKVLTLASGASVLVDLPKTTSLDHGGVLVAQTGAEIAVEAAVEPLLQVTAPDLTRIAWHIGNRHTPCQIEAERLLIRPDRVIADMLRRLGATVAEVAEPFTPEGGAYGHGRTHGHDHSHDHGPDTGSGSPARPHPAVDPALPGDGPGRAGQTAGHGQVAAPAFPASGPTQDGPVPPGAGESADSAAPEAGQDTAPAARAHDG